MWLIAWKHFWSVINCIYSEWIKNFYNEKFYNRYASKEFILLVIFVIKLIVIYGISGLFKILPTRGICNLRGLARVGYYLEWVVLNNPRMPYNVLSNIPQFLDNDIIDEILLPMGYER
jgi:hypothetical protein